MSRVLDWTAKTGLSPLCSSRYTDEQRWQGIKDKAKRLLEEAQELVAGAEIKDGVEVLDGVLDVRFVLEQLFNDLSHYGFHTTDAWEDVCDNNDLKTSNNKDWMVRQMALHTQRDGERKYYVDANEFDGQLWYCLKRFSDNKVSKPVDFERVELAQYVPKEFQLVKLNEYVQPLIETDSKYEFKLPTGDYLVDITTEAEYNLLTVTGMQHEMYRNFPESWEALVKEREEKDIE